MEKNFVSEIKRFVKEQCILPTSSYQGIYETHLVHMVKLALELAAKLRADLEIVEIAAWLHDIGSIVYGRDNHHVTGAKIAEQKLNELGYPKNKIERVKKCILNHRGSQKNDPWTIEEKVIIEADAMSNFGNIVGIFEAAFVWEKKTNEEAKKSIRQKLINKWNQLSEEGKEIIRPKYEAAILLLNGN